MKFKFDFNVDAWIQDVEIDAATEEEAITKLGNMPLSELISEGYVKDFSISKEGFDVEVTERTVIARCYDLSYDPEDVAESEFSEDDLPKEFTVTVEYVEKDDDLEELLGSELDSLVYDDYGIFPTGFKFDVLEEK